MNYKPKVFLNYAREDEKPVEELYGELQAAGTVPWMDTKDLLPGQDWKLAIKSAILEADFFVVCLSSQSVNKRGFVQREIKHAQELWTEKLEDDIYMIPLRLDECDVPSSLAQFQWLDLFAEEGFSRLLNAIRVGSERLTTDADRDRSRSTAEPSTPQVAPRFFYYISKEKVEMLLPQLQSRESPQDANEPLVTRTLRLIHGLDRNDLVAPVDDSNDLVASQFYSSKAVWRNGLFYFGTMVSVTVAYFLWMKHGDAIIVLAGSPDNVIGQRVVAQGVHISSTGDAIDSLGSMQILEAINTDEVASVVVGGGSTSTRIPAAKKRLALNTGNPLEDHNWLRDRIYTHSRETGLAIFCMDHLAQLPQMMIETVFRVYSRRSAERGTIFDDLKTENEKGREEYPTLYTDECLEEAKRIGLPNLRTIYVGSPLYTAIG